MSHQSMDFIWLEEKVACLLSWASNYKKRTKNYLFVYFQKEVSSHFLGSVSSDSETFIFRVIDLPRFLS